MARVLGSEARHTARGGLLVRVLRSSVSVLLLKARPPCPRVLAEPSACALNGVQSGRSVAPRLGRKDTLLVQQNIQAPHSGRLLFFLFLLRCPNGPKETPSSICPLWAHLTVLWLQGKDGLVSTNGSMLGFARGALSYLCSPFSQRIAGQVSVWGLISPKYGISFSAWRMLSTLLFICPPPTPLPVSS